jgi:hypothetical protein
MLVVESPATPVSTNETVSKVMVGGAVSIWKLCAVLAEAVLPASSVAVAFRLL